MGSTRLRWRCALVSSLDQQCGQPVLLTAASRHQTLQTRRQMRTVGAHLAGQLDVCLQTEGQSNVSGLDQVL